MTTQKSPYEVCPVYESEHFLLKLISPDDAEDLMVCYNDPEAQEFFNSDNCDFGYGNADTVEKIKYNIKLWLDAYHNKQFIRFSLKQSGYVPFNKSKAFDRDNYYIKKNVL